MFSNKILDSLTGITKFLEYSFVSSSKTCGFKTSGLKILKLCLNILNVPMLILLVAYVTKYHWGIQTKFNNLLQLSKWKQGIAIIGVGEGACIEFMRTPLQGPPCVNSLHSFGACFYKNTSESLHLHIYNILRLLFLLA